MDTCPEHKTSQTSRCKREAVGRRCLHRIDAIIPITAFLFFLAFLVFVQLSRIDNSVGALVFISSITTSQLKVSNASTLLSWRIESTLSEHKLAISCYNDRPTPLVINFRMTWSFKHRLASAHWLPLMSDLQIRLRVGVM